MIRQALWRVARTPFETFIGFIALTTGLSYAFGAPTPGSIDSTLPDLFILVWGAYLIAGGALVLLGVLVVRRLFAPGLFVLAGGIVVYSVALFASVRNVGAGLPASINLALAAACMVRALQVRRERPLWTRH